MNAVKMGGRRAHRGWCPGVGVWQCQLHQGYPRGQAGFDRAVGERQGDGQHPRVGWRGAIVIGGGLLLVGGKKG